MKLDEIEKGKKYWKAETVMNGRTRKKEVTGIAVYVLQVDQDNKKVLASMNGTPAQWFNMKTFCRWKTTDPSSPKTNY